MFFKKLSIYVFSNYLQQFLGFFTSFGIRRFILPADFGVWTAINMVLNYCLYSDFGVFSASYKEIPFYIGKKDYKMVESIKSLGGTFIIFVILLITPVLIGVSFFIKLSTPFKIGLFTVGIMFFLTVIFNFFITLFRAYNEFISLSKIILINSIVILVSYLLFSRYWQLYGLYAAAIFSLSTVVIYIKLKHNNIVSFHLVRSLQEFKKISFLLKTGVTLMIVGFVQTIFITIDKWVIIKYLGLKELGYYSIAIMAFQAIYAIPKLISHVTFPKVQELYGTFGEGETFDAHAKKYISRSTVYAVYLIPIIIGIIYIWGPSVITWVIPKYIEGIPSMNILLIGSLFVGISYFSNNFLLTLNKYILLLPLLIISGLVTFFSSIYLINKGWGIEGAAFSANIGYFLFFCLTSWTAFKNIHTSKEIISIYIKILLVLAYYAAVIIIPGQLHFNSVILTLVTRTLLLFFGASLFILKLNRETGLLKKLRLNFA